MENKHYCFRQLCRVKIILFIWTISLLGCYSYGEELVDCYIDIKDISLENKEKLIQNCDDKNEKDGNELFICVKKTGVSTDLEDGYLTCGFEQKDYFKCEKDRIEGDKCTKTDKTGNIDDCVKYDGQEAIKGQQINNPKVDNTAGSGNNDQPPEVEKMPCYPENHICNKYNENKYKGYYKLDSNDGESRFFFLYKKNAKPESKPGSDKPTQNCILNIFPCDFKVKNESPGDKNLVLSDTKNKSNKKFIANINANLGDMSFFKYVGSCKYSECKNIEGNILSKPYYYKYAHDSNLNDNTVISYFEKNIQAQYIGVLCNNYLANCVDIRPSDSIGALYNNNLETNNTGARINFYNDNITGVREEHLWFVEAQQGASAICLSVIGVHYKKALSPELTLSPELNLDFNYCSDLNESMTNLKYPEGLNEKLETPNCFLKNCSDLNNKELEVINSKGKTGKIYCSDYSDVGYCSDLNEDMTDLKYPEGLTILRENKGLKIPNCYLKSCIDLTKEELEIINSKGKLDRKYCSEYYWLSNHKGLKYFPKEKPIFCSELEDVDKKGKQLKFRYKNPKIDSKEPRDEENGLYKKEICTTKKQNGLDLPDIDEQGNCKKIERTEYYSYGGGRNKNKDNCYLKNCFSLTEEERQLISEAKFINIGFEIERAFALNDSSKKETNYNQSNIPVYCDNGFLFNKKFPGYEEFDYLNLNIIPCKELKNKHDGLNLVSPLKTIPFSTILNKKHDTTNEYRLCRSSYKPLNNLKNDEKIDDKMSQSKSFFETMAVIADESDKSDKSDKSDEYQSAEDKIGNLPDFPSSEYKMVKFNNQELKNGFKSSNIYAYSNVCSYVDNNFLYYNAEISSLKSSELKTNEKLAESSEKVKNKSKELKPGYSKCLEEGRVPEKLTIEENGKITGLIDNECADCLSNDSPDKCLYDFTGEDCKKYVANEYYCKRQHCEDNDEYCYFEDDLKKKLIDCSSYESSFQETTYFDCELYFNNINDHKDDILNLFKVENNSEVETIRKACESMLPPRETRNLVESNLLYKLAKPNKIDISYKSNSSNKPGKYDLERYGCAKYDEPSFGYGLYGCKLPDFSSSYISTMLYGTMADGEEKPSRAEIKFSKRDFQNNNINQILMHEVFKISYNGRSSTGINVCSRYPNSVYDNKCGQREGSKYYDNLCITLAEDKTSDTLEDPESNAWIFTESIGGTRFRMSRTNRDVFVFRDFHTYHYCYSNFEDKFRDGTGYGVIYGAGVALFTLPSTIGCIAGCILAGPLFKVCYLICVPSAIAISSALYATIRMEEWLINLQNDLHIPRGYVTPSMCSGGGCENSYHDKGMITKALLTNNDNYVYRFYPRSSNIETDIKNKLENNVKGKDRFFYETTLGVDIIKKCKLSNLLVNSPNCSNSNDCDYNYQFNKLDAKGNVIGSCGDRGKIKDCLDPALVECIDSYGVRFFDEEADFNGIDLNLTLKEGGFLKKYNKGDIAKDDWGTSSNEKTRTWVPVDIVYYTKDTQTEEQLKNNENCKMGFYGDPIGDLARCRGFEINCKESKDEKICRLLFGETSEFKNNYRGFYTESQSVKVPLFGSPFFFYTLITPNNTPNLFDPSFFLEAFFHSNNNNERVKFISNDGVILDFFNPKLVFKYDFKGAVSDVFDKEYKNFYDNENNYISQINADSLYSPPYVLKYKSDMISEIKEYDYALQKSYSMGLHEEYMPEVRVYRIKATYNDDNSLELDTCKNQTEIRCAEGNSFISVDNNVASYNRAPLGLNNFTMKQLTRKQIKDAGFVGAYFLHPRIEVSIGPVENNSDSTKSNSGETYLLTQGEDKYIKDFGKSDVQGYGINLTRSYCSKLYYDYYEYLNTLEREKKGKNDPYEINRLNKVIMAIESEVRKECDQENGEETEILINESEMFTEKDKVDDKSKAIVAKETAIVRKYNESYGGFNEVCISDYDIEKIFELRKEYGMGHSKMPSVIAFKDENDRQRKTKCILNKTSRSKKECLVAYKVYVYCGTEQKRLGSDECKEYLDLNTFQKVWVKTFDCYDPDKKIMNPILTKDLNEITSEEMKILKACFKGGFNYSGNIQKDSSDGKGGTDFVDPCLCEVLPKDQNEVDSNNKIDINNYTVREMTPREYGLCVDLEKPSICPAVRYYGINKEYIDDNLALNKTKAELDAEGNQNYYEQHLWRTEEKQVGILPSVFYTKTLGHAEFPASIYCGDYEEDCIGGSKIVSGQCYGYWKQNGDRVPKAICTKTKTNNGNFYYEYKLYSDKENESNECIRYSCPKIGYDSGNREILDEKDIESKSSNLFTVSEVNDFVKINGTDYTSFTNNEETSADYVDRRGAFNGFAIWKSIDPNDENPKDQESGDFAIQVTATKCLTGFAPNGSNDNIYYLDIYSNVNYVKDPQDKYDYVSGSTNYKKNLKEITSTYIEQSGLLEKIVNIQASKLPVRLCNQKGEWQASNDVYNLLLIDKKNQNNNYYYNSPNNYWFKNLWPKRNITSTKYCERLVCKELDPNNENIYLTEFFDPPEENSSKDSPEYTKDKNTKDKTWLQNGGAYWSATSAPRNSSNVVTIDNNELTPDKSSTDIVKIYTNKPVENFVENKYKYVKKVRGICRNEYGYYNRGTKFFSSFTEQIDNIRNRSSNKNANLLFTEIRKANKNIGSIDWYIINKENAVPPYRMCTSTGLWGGITGRCFRACEMLDIFQTEVDDRLYKDMYKDRNNYVEGGNFNEQKFYNEKIKDQYFIENHYIKRLDITKIDEISNDKKKKRFDDMGLRTGPGLTEIKIVDNKEKGGLRYGDFLTGGAQWARSIVTIDKSQIETEGPKKGMRYVEVEGVCDASYDSDDDEGVTQYLNSDENEEQEGIHPIRRCYEDGTWGPVYMKTRCALAKNCSPFELRVVDFARLIKKHNELGKDGQFKNDNVVLDFNRFLAKMYLTRKKRNNNICTVSGSQKGDYESCNCNNPDDNLDANKSCLCCSTSKDDIKTYDTCKCCGSNSDLSKDYDSCGRITTFLGDTGSAIRAINKEKVIGYSDFEKEKYDNPGYLKLDINERAMICNKSAEQGVYVSGWSFEKPKSQTQDSSQSDNESTILDKYFIPRTCKFELVGNRFLENIIDEKNDKTTPVAVGYLNRLKFANNSKENSNDKEQEHYSKESLLQVVYNELHRGNNEKYTEKLYANTESIVNDSYKNVEIGSKNYMSYQLSATCNNKYFYNEITGNDYYNKHIVFECSGNTCKGKENCQFMHHKETGNNSNFIKADACLPKTCGNEYDENQKQYKKENIYQLSWSKSYVQEVVGKTEKIDGKDENKYAWYQGKAVSELNCNKARTDSEDNFVESAFVVRDPSAFIITNSSDPKKKENILTGYKDYLDKFGFASKINIKCSAIRSEYYYSGKKTEEEFKTINGKTAANTYDAHRYGDLSFKDVVGKTFCTDLARKNCTAPTEADLADGTEFRKKYCVKMVCPKTGLKLDTAKHEILTDQTGADTFSLPGKEGDYTFGTVVAIQSLAGDFDYYRSKNSYNSPDPKFKYVQYDNAGTDNGQIKGKLCPDNQDIYNKGAPADYSYDVYYSRTSENKVTVVTCFNNLESTDTIKIDGNTSCDAGYENKNRVCIKYSQVYKDKIKLVSDLSKLTNSYNLGNENDFKAKVARFVVEKILFDNPKYHQSIGMIGYIKENIIQKAKENAKTEATKKFEESSTFCFYDYDKESKDKYKKSNLIKIQETNIKYDGKYDGDIYVYNDSKNNENLNNRKLFGLVPDTVENKCLEESKIKYGISVTCKKDKDEKNKCVSKETAKDKYCENGYSSSINNNSCELETIPLIGEKYQEIKVFDEAYNVAYEAELKKLKAEFKKALAGVSTSEIFKNIPTEFKELFEEYYKIFKMGEFLSVGSNLNLYKSFLSDIIRIEYLVNYEKGANEGEKFELEKIYGLKFVNFYKILEDSTNLVVSPSEFNNNKCYCGKVNNNGSFDKNDCDIDDNTKEYYKKYFVNFIGSAEYNKLIDDYKKYFNSEKTKCEEIYKDYKDYYYNTYKGEIESNKSNYKNGLYMVMKCEPDGWKISDSVDCKSRCTGYSGFVRLDPTGTGDFEYRLKLKMLRYSKKVETTLSSHAACVSCSMGTAYSSRSDISGVCQDNGINWSYNPDYAYGLSWDRDDGPFYCLFGFCDECWIASRIKLDGKQISYVRPSWKGSVNSKVVYVCPGNIGGMVGDGWNEDCSNKIENVTEIGYHIKNK